MITRALSTAGRQPFLSDWGRDGLSSNIFEFDPYFKTTSYYMSSKYKKKYISDMLYVILEELISKTWYPLRVYDWCLDEDEKRFRDHFMK